MVLNRIFVDSSYVLSSTGQMSATAIGHACAPIFDQNSGFWPVKKKGPIQPCRACPAIHKYAFGSSQTSSIAINTAAIISKHNQRGQLSSSAWLAAAEPLPRGRTAYGGPCGPGAKNWRKFYATLACSGVHNKDEQHHKWLPHPCLLRSPKEGAYKMYVTPTFSGVSYTEK